MTSERDGADSAMEEAARLQIELDELHAKAHRIQLRHEAAEAKLAKIRSYFLNERYPDPGVSYAPLTVTGVYDDILAILDGDATPTTPVDAEVQRCPESLWQPHGTLHPSDCPICGGTGWLLDAEPQR